MPKKDPYAAQDDRLAREEKKKKYETKDPEDFQVPKWMLVDNHPETEQGKSSPSIGDKNYNKKPKKWKSILEKRRAQHDQ